MGKNIGNDAQSKPLLYLWYYFINTKVSFYGVQSGVSLTILEAKYIVSSKFILTWAA